MFVSAGRTLATPAGSVRCDARCQSVVVGETVDVMVEGVETHRCQHAGLLKRAADTLLHAPCLLDKSFGAGEHGAHRCTETL